MADKTTGGLTAVAEVSIGDLPGIIDLYDETLIPVEQQGEARHMTGRQWRKYAEVGVAVYVEGAKEAAEAAEKSAGEAREAAETATSGAEAVENSAAEAKEAAESAEEARKAVEDMTVTSESLEPGEAASVTKTLQDGVFNLNFGIPKGEPGVDGTSFVVLGRYETLEELLAAHPYGNEGEAWAVGSAEDNEIYIWDVDSAEWKSVGSLQGTIGPPGPPGEPGPGLPAGGATGQIPVKQSEADYDVEWQDVPQGVGRFMAGKTVEPTQGTTVTAADGAEIFNDYRTRTYAATDEGYETILPATGNIASKTGSHAEGNQTTATGSGSHAEGNRTTASGSGSHAEGGCFTGQAGCIASGYGSHAEGVSTEASGDGAHAEGRGTKATATGAHAEGYESVASKGYAHAEGYQTTADGLRAHAEGRETQAIGQNSHAEGYRGIAEGNGSHVEGGQITNKAVNKASGYAAHAEGASTLASGAESHAEGQETQAIGNGSHAEGSSGIAEGSSSHVEGGWITGADYNKASGYAAHAEGASTLASGDESHAEGEKTTASGRASHSEGYSTTASTYYAHAEGNSTTASGSSSHAEGGHFTGQAGCIASGYGSHAEGVSTEASSSGAHAEGQRTKATAVGAHAEGYESAASNEYAHAEGSHTTASGARSHAEGYGTVASNYDTHAEGGHTQALATYSHAGGQNTLAEYHSETAIGRFNIKKNPSDYNTLGDFFVVGKGTADASRANAFRVSTAGVYGTAAFNASGADYAELFEWADGNPENADRVGRFVTLEGESIRLARPEDDYILGIVSGSPSVVGDVYDDQWQGMYLSDIFGRPIWEDVEVPAVMEEAKIPEEVSGEEDGALRPEYQKENRVLIPAHTERRQKLNPDYDSSQPYIPRSERPEWDAVGMLGKLVAVDDGTCRVNGWAAVGEGGAATASEERTRYRVMARLDETHVRILIL